MAVRSEENIVRNAAMETPQGSRYFPAAHGVYFACDGNW